MLKKDITYENFDGDMVTDTHYFNINKSEIVELELEYEGGIEGFFAKIIATKNEKELWNQFKRIVLMSYGEKSEDGKRFIKTEELGKEFSQTLAFDALLMEFMTSEDALVEFIIGALPREVGRAVAEKAKADGLSVPESASPLATLPAPPNMSADKE